MTTTSIRYVGLDVHKRVVEVCIVDHTGKVVHRERFPLNRRTLTLFATQVLRPTDHVALEATTNSWAVADVLRPHVACIVVSNPLATKAIAQAKVKTDKVDAHVLAQLLRCDFLPEVWQPDEATRRLRELTARRSALVGQRTMFRNRIHSVLAMRLVETPLRLFNAQGLQWLDSLELDDQARWLVDSDRRQIDFLQKEIDAVDLELAQRGYQSEPVKLLMTLPGVDVTTAEALLAAWGDAKRFPDADHAASYLGLTPSTHQSANLCYHGPITKRGNSQARWMLIEAAQHLDKHPGPLGHFFRRLAKKKNRNVAVVAAARKLAAIGWQMLVNGEPYRYAIPRSTATKLLRLRVKATGKRRPGGSPKGTKCTAKLPGGGRTIRSLPEVCRSEGLPPPGPLSPGEQRTVAANGCDAFVQQIARTQLVPRRASVPPTCDGHDHASAPQAATPNHSPTAASSGRTKARVPTSRGRASCQSTAWTEVADVEGFRPPRADEPGDAAPPPAPPTLFPGVPKRKSRPTKTTKPQKSQPAS
jgi:transposase